MGLEAVVEFPSQATMPGKRRCGEGKVAKYTAECGLQGDPERVIWSNRTNYKRQSQLRRFGIVYVDRVDFVQHIQEQEEEEGNLQEHDEPNGTRLNNRLG